MARFLDKLDQERHLAQTILYTINPADNYMVATMIGNFQEGPNPGKIQFGSGWWFNDQKYGIDKEGIQIHLWAYKLKFKHPVKDEIIEFEYMPNYKNM